jgi:hypothetical protein
VSAHPALYKACEYFCVKLIKLPICPRTLQLTPEIVRPHISALSLFTKAFVGGDCPAAGCSRPSHALRRTGRVRLARCAAQSVSACLSARQPQPTERNAWLRRSGMHGGCADRRTVAIYASCPSFTHGVIDPIQARAAPAVGGCRAERVAAHPCAERFCARLGRAVGLQWPQRRLHTSLHGLRFPNGRGLCCGHRGLHTHRGGRVGGGGGGGG